MPRLKDIREVLEDNFIARKGQIHTLVDTLETSPITLVSGVRTLMSNDGSVYEEYSDASNLMYNKTTGLIDAGTVEYAKQEIVVGGVMNSASANTRLKIELVIPYTPEIIVRYVEVEINRVGVDISEFRTFAVYSGPLAILHGYHLYATAIGGNIDLYNKSLLIRL